MIHEDIFLTSGFYNFHLIALCYASNTPYICKCVSVHVTRMGKTGRFARANPAKNVHLARAGKPVHLTRVGKLSQKCPFCPHT